MVCCFFVLVDLVTPLYRGDLVPPILGTGLVTPLYRGDLVPPTLGTGLVTPLGFKPRTFRTGI